MQMPGRKFSNGGGYRYGFNGQENSDEIAAGLTTAMYWEYDSRLGRRWNVDPQFKKFPNESPYLVFHNTPILFSDPNGDTPPKNFKEYKNTVDGGSIFLPKNANVELFTDKNNGGDKSLIGKIRAFTIGSSRFVTGFIGKTTFVGYVNFKQKNQAYRSPDIQVFNKNGLSKTLNTVSFDLTNIGETGISSGQVIQTVQTTNDVRSVSSVKYIKGGFYGFVDGGVNSPAYKKFGRENSNAPGEPYYIGTLGSEPIGSISAIGGKISINMVDAPNVSENANSVTNFQTIIIATNFYGSGLNVIMGVYNWNASAPQSVIEQSNQTFEWTNITNVSKEIIKTDYPRYNLKE
jgi:hypothetical protein